MPHKPKPIGLYLESASDYRITKMVDTEMMTISLPEAKALYASGVVKDYNIAFGRLVDNDFDVEAVKKFYERCAVIYILDKLTRDARKYRKHLSKLRELKNSLDTTLGS